MSSTYNGENAEDLFAYGTVSKSVAKGISIGTVATLPVIGSEMNNGGVITSRLGKLGIFSLVTFSKFSILNTELTYTLPETQVANGIVDTFIHTVEQYLTFPAEGRF